MWWRRSQASRIGLSHSTASSDPNPCREIIGKKRQMAREQDGLILVHHLWERGSSPTMTALPIFPRNQRSYMKFKERSSLLNHPNSI